MRSRLHPFQRPTTEVTNYTRILLNPANSLPPVHGTPWLPEKIIP